MRDELAAERHGDGAGVVRASSPAGPWGSPGALERQQAELEMQMGELAVRMAEAEKARAAAERERLASVRARAAAEKETAEATRRVAAATATAARARAEAAAAAEAEGTLVQETLSESTAALAAALQQVTQLRGRVADLEARLTAAQRERDAALAREATRERTAAAAAALAAASAASAAAAAPAAAAPAAAAAAAPKIAPTAATAVATLAAAQPASEEAQRGSELLTPRGVARTAAAKEPAPVADLSSPRSPSRIQSLQYEAVSAQPVSSTCLAPPCNTCGIARYSARALRATAHARRMQIPQAVGG